MLAWHATSKSHDSHPPHTCLMHVYQAWLGEHQQHHHYSQHGRCTGLCRTQHTRGCGQLRSRIITFLGAEAWRGLLLRLWFQHEPQSAKGCMGAPHDCLQIQSLEFFILLLLAVAHGQPAHAVIPPSYDVSMHHSFPCLYLPVITCF